MSDEFLGTVIDIFFVGYGIILVAGTAMTLVFLFALVRGRKMLAQVLVVKKIYIHTKGCDGKRKTFEHTRDEE